MKNPVAKHSRKFNLAAIFRDRKKESKKNPEYDEEDFCQCERQGFQSCQPGDCDKREER